MLRFADLYADKRQTTDKPIVLPLIAAHVRTQRNKFGDISVIHYH